MEKIEKDKKKVKEETPKSKNPNDVNLKSSGLPKFDKAHEFIVLKGHIFEIQSISIKKIIIKNKRKLSDTDKLADGCYVFVDKDDKLLLPRKVFSKFKKL